MGKANGVHYIEFRLFRVLEMDLETLDVFFSNTTPQFYVILTGTSTIISGVVLVC